MPLSSNKLYRFGEFVLDPSRRTFARQGKSVSISPKAFDVLTYLVNNPGRVVTKEELLKAVWPDSFVEEGNLAQHISWLRKALGDESNDVVTVPGRGYQFAAQVREEPAADLLPATQPGDTLVHGARERTHMVIEEVALAPVADKTPRASTRAWPYYALAALGVIVVAVWAGWRWWRPVAHSPERVMLAVLPFKNFTGSDAQDYLSDGLTEEIITELARLDATRLGVIARTSVMKFSGTSLDVAEVGRQLGVEYILEGAVRSGPQRLGITAQLIRVSDQTHLWAEEYELDPSDPLSWERRVAERTADALSMNLLPGVWQRQGPARAVKPEAREAYLRGRYLLSHGNASTFPQALAYFQKAIESEPEYAEAYAGMADAYWLLGAYGAKPKTEVVPMAKAAALKALTLDDTLAAARAKLADIRWEYDLDFQGAGTDFRRAIESDANDAHAHDSYAGYLAAMGEFDEATREMKKAIVLDPLSLHVGVDLGRAYYFARQYDPAIAQFRKTLELDPNFARAHSQLGLALLEKGQYDEALTEIRTGIGLSGPGAMSNWLGYAYARAGRMAEAREQLAAQLDSWRDLHTNAWGIALTYSGLGDKDQAFAWLGKDLENHGPVYMIKAWPYWDPLRSDPRYRDLLRRIGLPP